MEFGNFPLPVVALVMIIPTVNFELCYGSTIDVKSSVDSVLKHHYDTSSDVYLKTSGNITIKVGSKLWLNCTIIGAATPSELHISWYNEGYKLDRNTRRLNDSSIQLEVDSVTWNDSGKYLCKETSAHTMVQPSYSFVVVGDVPGPAQAVWVNNVNFRTIVHWKRPDYTGGLPLHFSVQGQCQNTSDDANCRLRILCNNHAIYHQPGSSEYACHVMFAVNSYQTYMAFVVASNLLGSTRSDSVEFRWNIFDPLLTTPLPPQVTWSEEERHGSVRLMWKAYMGTVPVIEYLILYHKDGDKLNKSKTVIAPKNYAVIEGLSADSQYYFYLMTRFGRKVNNVTAYSSYSLTEVVNVTTKPSAPSYPPTLNCSSLKNTNGKMGQRNASIVYKLPELKYFNGDLKSLQVSYSCQRRSGDKFRNLTVSGNTSEGRVVIPGLPVTDECRVWIRMCISHASCSGISNICFISSQDLSTAAPDPKNRLQLVSSVVAGLLLGILLIGVVVVCKLRRRQKTRPRIPLSSLQLPSNIHGYDEIEEPLGGNLYDTLDVRSATSDDV